jgi:hypothetical protein
MTKRSLYRFLVGPVAFVVALALIALACAPGSGPYHETFDRKGSWPTADEVDATSGVMNGRYELLVKAEQGIFWATGGQEFSNGIFEVETEQLEGTLDNGYGMLFRIDKNNDSFYLMEISSDGYLWIGHCINGCAEAESLVNSGWFQSDAVRQGLNVTNQLKVQAEGGNMIFYVNDQEVGRVTHTALSKGDIGVAVETLGEGGVRVAFDNFKVTPLEK